MSRMLLSSLSTGLSLAGWYSTVLEHRASLCLVLQEFSVASTFQALAPRPKSEGSRVDCSSKEISLRSSSNSRLDSCDGGAGKS